MPVSRELDASAGALAFFGSELRHHRTRAGMTLAQLVERVNYSLSQLGSVELGKRTPSRDLAERCDEALNTGGALLRLWPLARKAAYATGFQQWQEIQQHADVIKIWEPLLVPGLLQTEEYARTIFSQRPDITSEEVEAGVEARLARQEILTRDRPVRLWVLLDEWVLRRPFGEPRVVRGQLLFLAEAARRPNVTIQVVPVEAQSLLGLAGAFSIASVIGEPDYAALHAVGLSHVVDKPGDVARLVTRYDVIRSLALAAPASLDLIVQTVEERWAET